jgi:hypothetical protein
MRTAALLPLASSVPPTLRSHARNATHFFFNEENPPQVPPVGLVSIKPDKSPQCDENECDWWLSCHVTLAFN